MTIPVTSHIYRLLFSRKLITIKCEWESMQVEWGLSLTKAGREDSQNQAEARDQSLAVLGQSQAIVSSELRLAQAQAQVVPHYRGSDARGWWRFPGVLQKSCGWEVQAFLAMRCTCICTRNWVNLGCIIHTCIDLIVELLWICLYTSSST